MEYFVYILKSLKDNRRYIGCTSDLNRRLHQHNEGFTESTRKRRPFVIMCFKKFDNKILALKYERYLKRLKGGKQLDIEITKMRMPM